MKRSINEHKLVPPHRIINDEEKQKLLIDFKVRLKNLPKISIKDPVVKTLKDAKVGDVVEIKRRSVTAGESMYYRVIIND
ncbi:MAG: DNA-directed RNA polymerase subunit H [Candidatus Nanoarchaeia archaeon]